MYPVASSKQTLIFSLDYSTNSLTEMPQLSGNMRELTTLDLSNNAINGERWPDFRLASVRVLRVDENQIPSLSFVRNLLQRFPGVETLSVSANPITSVSSYNMSAILVANELRSLDLSGCKVTKVTGQYVLQGILYCS